MDNETFKKLAAQAARLRKTALETVKAASSGHLGGSLSVADILAVLYFDKMNIDPQNPSWEERDRLVLSKGHCTPALYSALALRGYFPLEKLAGFRHIDSDLSGHAEMTKVPGVDMSAGSLGQGLSAAVGMALSAKCYGKSYHVYCIVGDGEIQEGQIWEAAMAAGHYKLDNLTVIVDNNGLQIDGCVEQVMSPYPIGEKFAAFGWQVWEADGHNLAALGDALDEAKNHAGKPGVVVAKTVKGCGVSFMENECKWHGSLPTAAEFELALGEVAELVYSLEGR